MAESIINILIADDEPDVIDATSNFLMQLSIKFKNDVKIFRASSGFEVLAILANENIDALFLDYYFKGGISGDEIIERINDPFGSMLIILMSAREKNVLENILIKQHKTLGNRFKFLRKPYDELEIQDKYLEIVDFITTRPYPFPLAYVNKMLAACTTAHARITAIKDLIESYVKYYAVILMADIICSDLVDQFETRLDINKNLTMGAWIIWLEDLLKFWEPRIDELYMPEILSLLLENEDYFKMIKKFKSEVRDDEIGHGFLKEEEGYHIRATEYSKTVNSLISNSAFTSHYILLVPDSIEFSVSDSTSYDYRVRYLMGTDVKPDLVNLQSSTRMLHNDVVLFKSSGEEILSLSPFLQYSYCKNCSLKHLYMLDKVQPKQVIYNAYCNNRITEKERFSEFEGKLGKFMS